MRLDQETVEGDTVSYGYTGELLTTMGAMTTAYVPATGQLDTTTLGNVETRYTYDGFGDLAGILYEASNSAVYEVTYTRDTFGRVQTKTETRGATSTLRCYAYDASDRGWVGSALRTIGRGRELGGDGPERLRGGRPLAVRLRPPRPGQPC